MRFGFGKCAGGWMIQVNFCKLLGSSEVLNKCLILYFYLPVFKIMGQFLSILQRWVLFLNPFQLVDLNIACVFSLPLLFLLIFEPFQYPFSGTASCQEVSWLSALMEIGFDWWEAGLRFSSSSPRREWQLSQHYLPTSASFPHPSSVRVAYGRSVSCVFLWYFKSIRRSLPCTG